MGGALPLPYKGVGVASALNDNLHFYRFTEPQKNYPCQIELFSRKQDYQLNVEQGIIPIYIDEDTSSLSAILLNDDFYNFMIGNEDEIRGE